MSDDKVVRWQLYRAIDPTVERIIPQLAVEIGLNESIVLMQMSHWIGISQNVRNGVYWTYHSLREMHTKYFPYWSVATIRRTVQNLADEQYILIGNFNKRKGDNTQWFALNPDKLSSLKSVLVMPSHEVYQNETGVYQNETPPLQNETTLPEIPTETTTDIKRDTRKSANPSKSKSQKPLPVNRKTWQWEHIERYALENPDIDELAMLDDQAMHPTLKQLPTKATALDCIELYEEMKRNGKGSSDYGNLWMKTTFKPEYSTFRCMLWQLPKWLKQSCNITPLETEGTTAASFDITQWQTRESLYAQGDNS